ncbi:MAG: efflux RND transporter periplasmic adaptor subunit [Verrucomicrobiales bacterium]|nr:efflux RND transporter periplasmic adaptor subunit [Verrucomicrobiales bacterium]
MKAVRAITQFLLIIAVLGGAAFVSWTLFKTAPKTVPGEKKAATKIVQVIELKPGNEKIFVSAWGTVIPAREVTLQAQVSGRILEHHESLVPGGHLKKGEVAVRIDPADYKLNLTERAADLEEAEFELEVEQGRQIIAKREWEQLGNSISGSDANPALALREPHLKRARALIAKAENAVARAKLDLERTSLAAPFNSMVIEESVETGQLIETGRDICRLVGTDSFWVEVALPMSDLKWIRLPGKGIPGADVDIYLDTGNGKMEPWTGKVARLRADLEEAGRMARALVEIKNPLDLHDSGEKRKTPLLLGSYVRAEIEAGRLTNVLSIPRVALREGNRLWLVGKDQKIRITEPEILWTREETVVIPNILKPGETLIVSDLKVALPGMEVRPQLLTKEAEKS